MDIVEEFGKSECTKSMTKEGQNIIFVDGFEDADG